jgi:hypothetical protein
MRSASSARRTSGSKSDRTERWELQNEVNSLTRKVNEQEKRIAQLLEERARLGCTTTSSGGRPSGTSSRLKKPRKRGSRHLPTLSMVKRAGRDLFKDLPAAFGVTGSEPRARVPVALADARTSRGRGYNSGRGVLESILSENPNEHPADITQRDATVAATVVQWLGTNCGQSFLHEVQREIEKSRKRAAGLSPAVRPAGGGGRGDER